MTNRGQDTQVFFYMYTICKKDAQIMTWKRNKGHNSATTAKYRKNLIGLELACWKCEERDCWLRSWAKGRRGEGGTVWGDQVKPNRIV